VAVVSLAISLATYGYLLWRTHVGGPHLEFHVDNLRELVDYVAGSRYRSHDFLVYSLSQVLFERIPLLVKMIWKELGLGLILAGVGVFALRPRSVRTYLVSVFTCVVLLIANYNFRNLEYLIAACIPLVVLAAAGATRLGGPTRKGPLVGALLIAVCVAVTAASGLAVVRRDRAQAETFDRDLLGTLDRLGHGAFLMMEGYGRDYGEFEGLSYYVWGEGRGGGDVLVSTYQPMVTVANYVLRGVRYVDPVSSRLVPPRLRVFVSSRSYCSGMASLGVTCRPAGPGLFELLPPLTPRP
jgi:hypothetical protein